MLEALLQGKAKPEEIARLAKSKAKRKIPEILASLQGHRMSDHHRQMIRFSLEHLEFLEEHIQKLEEEIVAKIKELGYVQELELLKTLPGFQQTTASSVLAEIGPDREQFGWEKRLSSWAGVCPGNNRSAGTNKGSKTTRGNRWLRAALTEAAWGAAAKKDCFLKNKFWRVVTKKQRKPPAVVAVAHTLLLLSYQVLKTKRAYQERGAPILNETQKNRIIRHHVRRLGKLGIRVSSARTVQGRRKRPRTEASETEQTQEQGSRPSLD